MRSLTTLVGVGVAGLVLGCGGPQAQTQTAAPAASNPTRQQTARAAGGRNAEPDKGTPSASKASPPRAKGNDVRCNDDPEAQPEGAMRLGHFSTMDGSAGFVLDRTGKQPKLLRDGHAEVITLREKRADGRGAREYENEQADVWIRIESHGRVRYQGPDHYKARDTVRDANAKSLSDGPPAAVTCPEGASGQPQGKARLGHYSLVDGSAGFVLDQTATPPRLQRDGSDRVLELESQDADGRRALLELVHEGADVWLQVRGPTRVRYQGPGQHRGRRAIRDGNAQPLH